MTATRRRDERRYVVTMHDGRGAATVYVADGYGRAVTACVYVVGVRTEREAIAAARMEGMRA